MPHQCVHCKRIIPLANKELIDGCASCGGHFFFYIKDEQLAKVMETPIEIPMEDKKAVEKDIREIRVGDVKKLASSVLKNYSFFALVPKDK